MDKRTQRRVHHDTPKFRVFRALARAASRGLLALALVSLAQPATRCSSEVGIGSYLSKRFENHKTASGEVYHQNLLTAAHRFLPLNTMVRVTNLSNGKSVVVRINDRGPYVKGRIIDLSLAAAHAINLEHAGIAMVRLDVVMLPASKSHPANT